MKLFQLKEMEFHLNHHANDNIAKIFTHPDILFESGENNNQKYLNHESFSVKQIKSITQKHMTVMCRIDRFISRRRQAFRWSRPKMRND